MNAHYFKVLTVRAIQKELDGIYMQLKNAADEGKCETFLVRKPSAPAVKYLLSEDFEVSIDHELVLVGWM